jgi:hypothetical protein
MLARLCAAARQDGAKDDDPVQVRLSDLEEICGEIPVESVPAVKLATEFDKDHNLIRPDCYKP